MKQSNEKYHETMYDNYDQDIKQQTQAVLSLIQGYYDQETSGAMTEEEAQYAAKEAVRTIRYGDEADGYFWIDNTDFTLVMHPILPDNEGTNREQLEDQNGNMIIQMIKKTCLSAEGAGFNQFWFTKADGVTVAEKRAYSAYFEPWGWFISTGNYLDDIDAAVADNESNMQNTFVTVIVAILVIGVLMAVGSSLNSIHITKTIMVPLKAIRDLAGRMSEGDFSTNLEVKQKNEFGETIEFLNSGQEHLRKLMRDTQNIVEEVDGIVTGFGAAFATMNDSVHEVAGSMSDMAKGITIQAESTEKANENVNNISQGIRQTNEEVNVLNQKSMEMKDVSNQVMGTMEKLEQINTQVQEGIRDVNTQTQATNDSVQQISGAAQLIQNIAEQTNLLALNASIEAARAGESGRGFAVVANEIGSLSTQSSDAVKAIGDILNGLIRNSNQGMKVIQDISQTMEQQSEELKLTGEMFKRLYTSVDESLGSIGEIATMSKNMESQRAEITDSVETLSSMAQENAAGTEETSQISSSLLEMIEKLSKDLEVLNENVLDLNDNISKFTV